MNKERLSEAMLQGVANYFQTEFKQKLGADALAVRREMSFWQKHNFSFGSGQAGFDRGYNIWKLLKTKKYDPAVLYRVILAHSKINKLKDCLLYTIATAWDEILPVPKKGVSPTVEVSAYRKHYVKIKQQLKSGTIAGDDDHILKHWARMGAIPRYISTIENEMDDNADINHDIDAPVSADAKHIELLNYGEGAAAAEGYAISSSSSSLRFRPKS